MPTYIAVYSSPCIMPMYIAVYSSPCIMPTYIAVYCSPCIMSTVPYEQQKLHRQNSYYYTGGRFDATMNRQLMMSMNEYGAQVVILRLS